MARWIRRSLWCVVLGFATAWLVAWGLAVAMWADRYGWSPDWIGKGTGVVEPWLLKIEVNQRSGFEIEQWSGDRVDRENHISERNRSKADRVLEIGGAAYAEESGSQLVPADLQDWFADIEAAQGLTPGTMLDRAQRIQEVTERIDDQVASFPPPYLAARMATMEADHFFLYATRVGWPVPMLESVNGHEIVLASPSMQTTNVEENQIKIDALKRQPVFGPVVALSLPIGVIAPGAIANTLFYAVSWFALITGIELLRSLHRHMAGRCVRCGYDLRRVAGATCPECGRTKR